MKIILQENVKNLGRSGDVMEVKDGFARNYLIPRKLAVRATTTSIRLLGHQERVTRQKIEKRKKEMKSLLATLEGRSVTVSKAVGKDDKLYGSVTPKEIEAALLEDNIRVDRKKILLEAPMKQLGVYPVKILLDEGVVVEIKVWVVAR